MASFPTTRRPLALEAAGPDARPTALGELCVVYWPAVYGFIRSKIHDQEQAKDLTQAFFLRALEKNDLLPADPERARFRHVLLASVKHFLSNEWDRARAEKRGGGGVPLPLEFDDGRLRRDPADPLTPEKIFERRWAATLLRKTLGALRHELEAAGKGRHFEALKGCLTGDRPEMVYHDTGALLHMSEGAVKTAVHRMRHRFRELLRAEIARTVADASEVDEELRYLFSVVSS